MIVMEKIKSKIAGLGSSIPSRVVTNNDLTEFMETSHEWIVERTGIEERRWINEGESGSEMAANACKEAMEKASMNPADIDMLVYATISPDHEFPGSGVFAQRRLGLGHIAILDIRQQCTGFIYGMSIADNFIKSGMYKNILVVGSEVHSTGLDVSTRGRDTAALFGDGAGAALVTATDDEESFILSSHLHADGSEAEILWTEKPGSKYHPRLTVSDIENGLHFPIMEGRKVFKHAVTRMAESVHEGLKFNNLQLSDLDMLIPHQANLRINEMLAKTLGLGPDNVHNNIQKYGNTTAATIPICMKEAVELGKIKKGDLVCLVAFGSGLTWGSVFLRY